MEQSIRKKRHNLSARTYPHTNWANRYVVKTIGVGVKFADAGNKLTKQLRFMER